MPHTYEARKGNEVQMTTNGKTALVTGANSGLGFEAAGQLASLGYERVILACRSLEKANKARDQLMEKTGKRSFEVVAIDVADNSGVGVAVEDLATRGFEIDFLLLNAGLVASESVRRSKDGVEITVAASLVGHHILTTKLLNRGVLSNEARIVIAGSEAARGDVPMMGVTDIPAYAAQHHAGDRTRAILDGAKVERPYAYKNMPHYANTKVFVAWWAAALARRLPEGVTVNAISPGSAPATGVMRNQSRLMKAVMTVMMVWIGPLLGVAAAPSKAAARYLAALDYGPDENGKFFASKPGKMIGEVVEQKQPHIHDVESQEGLWRAVLQLAGGATLESVAELAPVVDAAV
jgi:NAD(P)-dependent dehydrogenase (short-subunit alcohol dehydrogenase family)